MDYSVVAREEHEGKELGADGRDGIEGLGYELCWVDGGWEGQARVGHCFFGLGFGPWSIGTHMCAEYGWRGWEGETVVRFLNGLAMDGWNGVRDYIGIV